jgi:hypothetical protein
LILASGGVVKMATMLRKNKLPEGVLEATRDPWFRIVLLHETTMRHIAKRHPELDGCELAVTTAVENASFRCRTQDPSREVLYAPNLGPAAWLAVVVAYGEAAGLVITAYGNKRGPRAEDII